MAQHDDGLLSIVALKETLAESVVVSWNPDGLLGVVGLEHVLTLHLQGDDKERARIRIRLTRLSKLDVARHFRC